MGPKVLAGKSWEGRKAGGKFPPAGLLFQTIYGQFNVPAVPSEYRNLTDFETVKECSSRRQSLVFVPILPSRLFIEMLGNGELNF